MADEQIQEESHDQEQQDVQGFLGAIDVATGKIKETAKPAETIITAASPAVKPEEKPAQPEVKTETVTPKGNEGDSSKPAVEEKKTETVIPKADWKQEIKKADRKEVLKELGLDDQDIDFVEFRKGGGDPIKFLEVQKRDWSKISDAEVLRYDLKKQFPDLDEEEFEILADKRINARFSIGEEFTDPKEKKAAELELKIEADAKRKAFKEEDSKFLLTAREADTEQVRQKEAAEKTKLDFLDFVGESEKTKAFVATKEIIAGEGAESVKIQADPSKVLGYVLEPEKFWSLFEKPVSDETGKETGKELDLDLLYAAINFALDRKGFEKTLIDHGKSLGSKSEEEELHNVPKTVQPKAGGKEETLLEAFAKRGRDVPL